MVFLSFPPFFSVYQFPLLFLEIFSFGVNKFDLLEFIRPKKKKEGKWNLDIIYERKGTGISDYI